MLFVVGPLQKKKNGVPVTHNKKLLNKTTLLCRDSVT